MLREFYKITGLAQTKLMKNCEKILSYARKEAKREVSSLLKNYDSIEEPTEGIYIYLTIIVLIYNVCLYLQDQTVIFCMSLATSLTTQRGKQIYFCHSRFGFFLHVIIIIYNFNLNHIMCVFL